LSTLTHNPVRSPVRILIGITAGVIGSLAGCGSPETVSEIRLPFRTMAPRTPANDSDQAALDLFSTAQAGPYALGPGDILFIETWGHDDLSGQHVVGPDGRLTLPVVGSFPCAGLTRDEAATAFATALAPYYKDLAITVRVEEYVSHRLAILGDVRTPGSFPIENTPTLLDALSRAGGVAPQDAILGAPTRCSIIRGSDTMIRLELDELLERGNTSLNIPLQPHDVIIVKHALDEIIYVMGEVQNPGMYPANGIGRMSVLDAIALAGGLTEASQPTDVLLIRTQESLELPINMEELYAGQLQLNVELIEGDILYVPRSGLATIGYFMRQVNPFALWFTASQAGN
jgi:polysaccharide export outer membrane protein